MKEEQSIDIPIEKLATKSEEERRSLQKKLLISDFKEVAEAIEKVSTFIKSSTAEEAVLKGILDRCESRQQDILHEIEFSMLSRKQRDILAKEIKNVRIERRNAKMLLELIEPFSHLGKSKSSSATFMTSLGT